ncbi:HlyD family secretion protein [Ancylobacter aquaticus]|uniref:HlyD family secretion protein n=2 Tax=Ancylobacter aquaticus TaxID=100 RepID=A0A4R1HU80_ANCAQ|nr:HlyD family secretion protein [Ancylobacter aquaticus]
MLRVVPSFAWVALAGLGIALVAAVAWSILSNAPLKVSGDGILLSPGGVADITTPSQGYLARLLVAPGDVVKAGQPVAVLDQPDLQSQLELKRLELEKLEDQKTRVSAFLSNEQKARDLLIKDREAGLRERIQSLRKLEATTSELLASQEALLERGLIVRERVLATRGQLHQTQADRLESESTLTQIATDEQLQTTRSHREGLEIDMRIAAADRDLSAMLVDFARKTRVTAPMDGVVVEQAANTGELIGAGSPILRMLPSGADETASLVNLVYVGRGEGKRIQPGMPAQIVPTTVRVQRDGFIRGTVTSVSAIPASREGMLRVLKNSTLVDQLTREGAPVAVTIALEVDPTTPTGYAWSSGKGPATPIAGGTMTTAQVVVGEIPIIALVIPSSEYLLTRLGL